MQQDTTPAPQPAPVPERPVTGISDRARLEAERRTVGRGKAAAEPAAANDQRSAAA